VLNEQINTLLNRPAARNIQEVGKLVSFLRGMKRTLAVNGIDFKDTMTSSIIMATFERKLPSHLSVKWHLKIEQTKKEMQVDMPVRKCATIDYGTVVTIDELLDWLETRVSAEEAARKASETANGMSKKTPQPQKPPAPAPHVPAPTDSKKKFPPGPGKKKGGKGAFSGLTAGAEAEKSSPNISANAAGDADEEVVKKKSKKERVWPDLDYQKSGCLGCGKDGHKPPECQKFLADTLANKWFRICYRSMQSQFCYQCFDPSHKAPGCKDGPCGVLCGVNNQPCQKRHHKCLHKYDADKKAGDKN
jgi:hypothetical protein